MGLGLNNAQAVLEQLVLASSEDEVTGVLESYGFVAYDDENWFPLGGFRNNAGTVHNQQSDPRGALAEKIVNSVDAVLTYACKKTGIDPQSHLAPKTVDEAAERFFDIPEGRISRLLPSRRADLAQSICVALTGQKPPGYPCVVIVDKGEGQAPDMFADTFLSLHEENKVRVPFVQGKYNMGGTGALRFCGKHHNYQLIVSRQRVRHMLSDDGMWGFTLIRRRPPTRGYKTSSFEYLAPGKRLLQVDAASLPLWPDPERGALQPMEGGTFIKLYEYQLAERTAATLDLYYALSRRLFRIAIPAQIAEMREYRGHTLGTILTGLSVRLEDAAGGLVEAGFPCAMLLDVAGIGHLPVTLALLRQDSSGEHYLKASEAIIFTVNGQAHAFLPRQFLASEAVGLKFLGGTLLVEVDCTGLDAATIEKLFMSSRDRMSQCDERKTIETELESFLKHHEGLKHWNELRRKEAMDRSTRSKETTEILQTLLKSCPELARLLSSGGPVRDPSQYGSQEDEFQGRRYPTYLELVGKPQKGCPLTQHCRVTFRTDAENSYFTRPDDPGEIKIDGFDPQKIVVSWYLWNGTLTLTIRPTSGARAGEHYPVRVRVSSLAAEVLPGWLTQEFVLEIQPSENSSSVSIKTRRRDHIRTASLPEILEMKKDEWEAQGWDTDDPVFIDDSNGQTVSFVNMDHASLRNFCYQRPKEAEIAREQFKIALTIAGVHCRGLRIRTLIEERSEAQSLRVLASVILPLLTLGKLEESLVGQMAST